MTRFLTLFRKEVLRFWKVSFQTIAAPVITSLLYLLVFGHVLEEHVQVYPGVGYTEFLLPGLAVMALLQNAFSNTSSSLIQSKMTGSLVFVLLSPVGVAEFFLAYVGAAVVRGLMVGFATWAAGLIFVDVALFDVLWIFAFAILGSALLGTVGLLAGIWADSYDRLAAFQNFLIVPATFLSGVFYSIHSLPEFWQRISWGNPFFYLIDGFRYGFFGVSDVSPWLSLTVAGGCFAVLSSFTLWLLYSGYKLRE